MRGDRRRVVFYLLFFGVLGLVAMIYYSAFFREAVGTLKLGGLSSPSPRDDGLGEARTSATSALVVLTLGIGYIFVAVSQLGVLHPPHGGVRRRSISTT